eukprot:scaffold43465_cov54-Phaeocystis_antarctica.AAC.3
MPAICEESTDSLAAARSWLGVRVVSPWSAAAHLFVLLASAQNLPEAKRLVGLVRVSEVSKYSQRLSARAVQGAIRALDLTLLTLLTTLTAAVHTVVPSGLCAMCSTRLVWPVSSATRTIEGGRVRARVKARVRARGRADLVVRVAVRADELLVVRRPLQRADLGGDNQACIATVAGARAVMAAGAPATWCPRCCGTHSTYYTHSTYLRLGVDRVEARAVVGIPEADRAWLG